MSNKPAHVIVVCPLKSIYCARSDIRKFNCCNFVISGKKRSRFLLALCEFPEMPGYSISDLAFPFSICIFGGSAKCSMSRNMVKSFVVAPNHLFCLYFISH